MRMVIDTNVFISSFFGGKPRQIIDLWRHGQTTLCLSPAILDEYLAVLRRMGLDGRPELRDLLDLFRTGRNIAFSAHPHKLRVVADDPDDDKFIACAVALHADVIVSGDRHLTGIADYMGIRILRPSLFLAEFGEAKS